MKRKVVALLWVPLLLVSCHTTSHHPQETTESKTEDTEVTNETEGSGSVDVTPVYGNQHYEMAEIVDQVKLLGRVFLEDTGLTCDHTASGVEFNAYIRGELRIFLRCDRVTYFTVFVDGERLSERFRVSGGNQMNEIILSFPEELQLHHIRLLKQTEAQHSLSVIESLDFYGVMGSRPQDAAYYVEFIGDSITCGAGNLWDSSCSTPSFSSTSDGTYEDGTAGYAFLTAEAMGADVSILSCSGIGVDQCWLPFRIADYYPARSYYRSQAVPHNFNNVRVPDLVVINLGTNDEMRGSTEDAYKNGVKELIQFVRSSYGTSVPILWICGMMSDGESNWTMAAIEELDGEDSDLYVLRVARDNAGGNSHPSLAAHRSVAKRVSRYIMAQDFYQEVMEG